MIRLRDHYFVSWLKVVKQREIHIIDSDIYVSINNLEYNDLLKEYESTLKPVLKQIRKFVRELKQQSSN